MDNLVEEVRREVLSFCTGEPIIATLSAETEDLDEYNLLIFVRSISDCTPTYLQSVRLHLFLPKKYPEVSPTVKLYKAKLFHPNFSASGEWMDNVMRQNETIEEYLMRLIRVLQFKEINVDKVADRNAMAWYNKNIDSGIFPTSGINYKVKPHIVIKKINNISFFQEDFEVRV